MLELKELAKGNAFALTLVEEQEAAFQKLSSTKTQSSTINHSVQLDFCPRVVELRYDNKVAKAIDLASTILPVHQERLALVPVVTGTKVSLHISGSPYNTKEVYEESLTSLYEWEVNVAGQATLLLQLNWNHSEKYVMDTAMIKDCRKLSDDAYPMLKSSLEEFDKVLASFQSKALVYFDTTAYAFKTAKGHFDKGLAQQKEYEVSVDAIYNSMYSIVSIGAFSWVAGLVKLKDVVEDMGNVTMDKVISLNSSKKTKKDIETMKSLYSILPFGSNELLNGSFNLTKWQGYITQLVDELNNAYFNINENIRDVVNHCNDKKIKSFLEKYTAVVDQVAAILDYTVPYIKENIPKFKALDGDQLATEIERILWALWGKNLKLGKKNSRGGGSSGMGRNAGRSANYNVEDDWEYFNDICPAIVERINTLKIADLSITFGGYGSVPNYKVAALLEATEKILANPKLSF